LARKRSYDSWDSKRYPPRKRNCDYGHTGRIGKRNHLCAGCLQDALEAAGWEYVDERYALASPSYRRKKYDPDDYLGASPLPKVSEALRRAPVSSEGMRRVLG
jgi:hypothetical protein